MRSREAAPLALLVVAAPVAAHDFWMEAQKSEGGKATIAFRIGTAEDPEDWTVRRERIVALRSFGPDGVQDQQADIVAGKPGSATVNIVNNGSHVVTLETVPVESDLPAAEFNDYAAHEGLSEVLAWRQSNGQMELNGRESYARRAKAIVQVGSNTTDNVTRVLGLSLEIVPETNPLAPTGGKKLPIRLYFRGKPLSGALVHCESLDGFAPRYETKTDADGRMQCPIERKGRWKVATVWSVPVSGNARVDFDTLFSSLTFSY